MDRGKGKETLGLENDQLWYRDAIIYEVHVRAFADSNADGIGDFRGLTGKLDYLQDLGVTALWLLPFYPSPLRDDGYDIAGYTDVHPDYGTLQDFKIFLKEAHRLGLRVIIELVINHTSDQHPWFQRARRAKAGSSARNFYVWSDTPERYQEARIIFRDFEPSNWAWDPIAKAYYWHRFYSHQPDLNFDNPAVQKAIFDCLDFWLDLGIDGIRMDAVPYLYEREGTNCENLPETHALLKEMRRHIETNYKNRMILAEANQWPEDAAAYFGDADECHLAFHFPLMPRLFMSLHMEDRYPIIDILEQTPRLPEGCQWALFLRNHDELTLEMVTDEDRDYMYRVYANDPQARINLGIRRRLAPLLGNHRRKAELMNCLLFSLPGTPVIYYGDEITMGDNIYLGDRNGVRTPMQWSADRNGGFSRANPQRLYLPLIIDPEYHYEAINVEAQQQNLHSFLWWMKRLIMLRKRLQAFGRGALKFLLPENRKVLAFIRQHGDETILVVANLSRFVQFAEFDLSSFKGMVPVELFGHTDFPPVGDLPYFITLGPHSFYWFKFETRRLEEVTSPAETEIPGLEVSGSWDTIFQPKNRPALEELISNYIKTCRWFGGKGRKTRSLNIVETIPVPFDSSRTQFTILEIQYAEGSPEVYLLPLAYTAGNAAMEIREAHPRAVVGNLRIKGAKESSEGVLYDALFDGALCRFLLESIQRRRRFQGESAEILALPSRAFRKVLGAPEAPLEPSPSKAEQTNTSIIYGDRLILKIFRRFQEGINPDLEIGRFITEKTSFRHIPPLAGALEYHRDRREPVTLGLLQGYIQNQGDAWTFTLDSLERYLEASLARVAETDQLNLPREHILDLATSEIPPFPREAIGPYLASAQLLAQRTAELHLALASDPDDPAFAPEPFTVFYRRSLYQNMRQLAVQALSLLGKRLKGLSAEIRTEAERVLNLEKPISDRLRLLLEKKITAMRMRCHGDYHLGQVLYTGKDFVIIDFEGEPARPIGERRLKRSPFKDVAAMLRSFHYAAVSKSRSSDFRPEDIGNLEPWARFWHLWVSTAFLKAYMDAAAGAIFVPSSREELKILLDILLLEKALYELAYELNNRPGWAHIPIQGILEIMERAG